MESPKYMTVGQVAKLVGCSTQAVKSWVDKGVLKGHRMPLSGDRRIAPDDLADFLKANGLEGRLPGAPTRLPRVLFVGFAEDDRPTLLVDGIVPAFAAAGVRAGIALERHRPDVVAVDMAVGRIEAGQVAAAAREAGASVVTWGKEEVEGCRRAGSFSDLIEALGGSR